MKNLKIFALLLFMTPFIACDDSDDIQQPPSKSITTIASESDQFTTLVSALARVNLASTLDGNGSFTVFAPTNAAFEALGVDLSTISDEELTEILLYHVLGVEVNSSDLNEGQTYASTLSESGPDEAPLSILIEKSSNGVIINNKAKVQTADISASNGVIHIIDAVLQPLDIVGHATANSNFSSLVNALSTASGNLVAALQGEGPFTVFAPLNEAFSAIESQVSQLNADELASVLTYHVISPANVRSSALSNGDIVETLNGENLKVILNNSVMIEDNQGNKVEVILADVQATNGVIHVVQSVLIP